jgi:hypothetical protein
MLSAPLSPRHIPGRDRAVNRARRSEGWSRYRSVVKLFGKEKFVFVKYLSSFSKHSFGGF